MNACHVEYVQAVVVAGASERLLHGALGLLTERSPWTWKCGASQPSSSIVAVLPHTSLGWLATNTW